jgi:hypothetical protein
MLPCSKKPHGHYTARLLTRLPITRFRRWFTNRPGGKWLHPDPTILECGGDVGLPMRLQGMVTRKRGR